MMLLFQSLVFHEKLLQFQYIQIQFQQMLELFQMLQVYFQMQTLFHLLLNDHLELQELFHQNQVAIAGAVFLPIGSKRIDLVLKSIVQHLIL